MRCNVLRDRVIPLSDLHFHIIQHILPHRLTQGGLLPSTICKPPRMIPCQPEVHYVLETPQCPVNAGGAVDEPKEQVEIRVVPWFPYGYILKENYGNIVRK